ncbi:hypothetical protein D7Y04_42940, partial [Corallococcus sp. AB038B]
MTSEIRVIHEAWDTRLVGVTVDGDSLWLDKEDFERATGWQWKAVGLCRDDTCMPIPRGGPKLVDGDRIDAAGVWRHAGWPV